VAIRHKPDRLVVAKFFARRVSHSVWLLPLYWRLCVHIHLEESVLFTTPLSRLRTPQRYQQGYLSTPMVLRVLRLSRSTLCQHLPTVLVTFKHHSFPTRSLGKANLSIEKGNLSVEKGNCQLGTGIALRNYITTFSLVDAIGQFFVWLLLLVIDPAYLP
jgi:hypothetical protein